MEEIANWVAPLATTIAAMMTASNLGSRITGYGFAVFTVGSLAWLALGIVSGQQSLVWQNIILTALNLFGIWRWLGREAKIEEGGKAAQRESQALPAETLFPASMLCKAPVTDRQGAELGKAVDAMVGARTGKLSYVVVSNGGVAGVGESFRQLPWSEAEMAGDTIEASIDATDFERRPTVERDEWPAR
jgi:hypothetical protein